MARQRVTADFVRYWELLKEKTGNSPNNVKNALNKHAELSVAIDELSVLRDLIARHTNHSKRRVIVQADPKFATALSDYDERWDSSRYELFEWRYAKEHGSPFELDLSFDEPPASPDAPSGPADWWYFSPEYHQAWTLVSRLREYLKEKGDYAWTDNPFFAQSAGALEWLQSTVGVDFESIERRHREFPVLIVPEQVSDRHGFTEAQSLYKYLSDARISFIFGAPLASISILRATTEMIFKEHIYPEVAFPGYKTMKLTQLINKALKEPIYSKLKVYNLADKVDNANDIMHANKSNDRTEAQYFAVIRHWTEAIQTLLNLVPRRP